MFCLTIVSEYLYDLHICVCFFFFKQKTAYEMRISDWSSDVCSSDLGPGRARITCESSFDVPADAEVEPVKAFLEAVYNLSVIQGMERAVKQEIGRASCRERVCQYV